MTTIIPFVPPPTTAFTFQPILDGATYNATVKWNIFGQRWYVTLVDGQGNRVFTLPLIGSGGGQTIETLSYDPVAQLVSGSTLKPHGLEIGHVLAMTVSGAQPDGYNGAHDVSVLTPTDFSYPLATAPGAAVSANAGALSYEVNIAQGYFSSRMVFREPLQQFEITP